MTSVRQDAWTSEEDLRLADIILRHIREGSTQLRAFQEAGGQLGRTAAACGYRWNAILRKEQATEIEIAKAERRARKEANGWTAGGDGEEADGTPHLLTELAWGDVLRFLRRQRAERGVLDAELRTARLELQTAVAAVEQLRQENERLRAELLRQSEEKRRIYDDYAALVQIMDRARKLTFLHPSE